MGEQTVQAIEKILARMKITRDRQKSYVDRRRKELEFSVADKVFLMITPIKGVLRFGEKEKLQCIGDVAY